MRPMSQSWTRSVSLCALCVIYGFLRVPPAQCESVADDESLSAWIAAEPSPWRGPREIASSLILPLRGITGAVVVVRDPEFVPGNLPLRVLVTPFMLMTGAMVGGIEAAIGVGGGLVDTFSGGYLRLLSDSWSEFDTAPIAIIAADPPHS